ncbi:DUF1667 domain-containing protein [Eubacteriaceae bacterium ES3]|nr:DUF1667 domain-containing protein [Eubacteriaceae bacterium ES3]
MKCDQICCTTCPSECRISVFSDGGQIIKIEGNSCKRGIVFAEKEMTDPVRTLTSTVILKSSTGEISVPVKSSQPIALRNMMDAMKQIHETQIDNAVKIGQVVIPDICCSGADIVACKTVKG